MITWILPSEMKVNKIRASSRVLNRIDGRYLISEGKYNFIFALLERGEI